ncbi:MAG TPA: VOC family protein [Candidatus Methylacidiphilales bacterium]|jgi:methylmalonyl-CoA/ethylmalonyl-CoA epimerase|nr:VOC family protein [Candidatus Methylacidiphilales bacterium]
MSEGATGLGITRLGQVAINAHDVERATAFYRDVLGLKFLFAAGQLAFFDCGGVRLMLDKAEDPEFVHPSSILYFSVAEIQAAHRRLVDAGVAIVSEPRMIAAMADHDLWMSFFRDTEDNVMALMCEVRR